MLITQYAMSTLNHLSCLLNRTPIENKLVALYSKIEDLKENAFAVHLNKKHNPIMTGEFLIIAIIRFFFLTNVQGTNKGKILCKEYD